MKGEEEEKKRRPARAHMQSGADRTDAALLHTILQLGNRRSEPNSLDVFLYERYFTVSTGISAPCSTP